MGIEWLPGSHKPHFLSVFVLWVDDMDVLREFLESSTIHGLSYIETSKVSVGSKIKPNQCLCNWQINRPKLSNVYGSLLCAWVLLARGFSLANPIWSGKKIQWLLQFQLSPSLIFGSPMSQSAHPRAQTRPWTMISWKLTAICWQSNKGKNGNKLRTKSL